MKKLIAFILTVFMLVGFIPVFEFTVSADDKGTVVFSQQYSGFITAVNTSDMYTVVLTEPGRLAVNITSESFPNYEAEVQWIASNGTNIAINTTFSFPYNNYIDLEEGTYYIKFAQRSGRPYGTGTYNLTATFTAANNTEAEPNNIIEQAQPLMSGELVKGFISYQDDIDYYSITLTQAGRLSLNLTRENDFGTNYVNIVWYKGNTGEIIFPSYNAYISSGYNSYMDLEAGIYNIKISKYNINYTGTYHLMATFTAANNTETEPNNAIPDEAQLLLSGELIK